MSDEFVFNIPVVKGEGVGVPVSEVQRAINSICQQTAADLNLIASGGFPLNNVNITGGTITGVTGATQGPTDNSLLLATDAFVNQQVIRNTATVPLSITGGIYNQESLGSGLQVVVFASGGVITGILSIAVPGSGYAVGDILVLPGGNSDAVIRVTVVGGGGSVTTTQILYGGTGYSTGAQIAGAVVPPGERQVILTGTLTSNATIIIAAGNFNNASRRPAFVNNTTGAFTVTVALSNGAGGTTGSSVVLPQGTANSSAVVLETDGETGVWIANTPLGIGALPSTSPTITGATITSSTINSTSVGATTPSTGAFTTLTASTPVGVASGGTGLGALTAFNVLVGNGTGNVALIAPGAAGIPLTSRGAGTNPAFQGITVPGGGTGQTTLTAHSVLLGEGTGAVAFATGTTGQMLIGVTGADPAFGNNPTITGGTIDNAVIGGTTPAAVTATTLVATGMSRVIASTTNALSLTSGATTVVTTFTATVNVGANFVASTGVYTAPATGQYAVSAAFRTTSATVAANTQFIVIFNVNGAAVQQAGVTYQSNVATTCQATCATVLNVTSGQTITVSIFQSTAATLTLDGAAAANWLTISRLY
jgi:hypothetical protein